MSFLFVASGMAQHFASNSMNIGDGIVTGVWGPPKGAATVVGAAYSAEELLEYTAPDGGSHRSNVIGRYARDGKGRIRQESAFKPAPVWLKEIFDPVAGVAYLLDEEEKIAHRMLLPARETARVSPLAGSVDLGEKYMDGLLVHGKRTTGGLTIDTWESPELKLQLLTISSNGYSSRLINVSRAEPDPALFQPPAGYKVVDHSEPFPMTLRFSAREQTGSAIR